MIKAYWDKLTAKVDALSLRERVLIFAAAAFLVASLVDSLLLEPLLAKQRALSAQVVQQQERIKEVDAQIEALQQARKASESSPQRQRLNQLRQQLVQGDAYIQGRRDRLVPPEKMAELLEQVLRKNGRLQLVKLQTLPVAPLLEEAAAKESTAGAHQIFKHGVEITVRGNYLDMVDYLVALEHLPSQMYWGMAQMNVIKYPVAELTLTVYTLSLDRTWMRV